jgi:hypothetical protein
MQVTLHTYSQQHDNISFGAQEKTGTWFHIGRVHKSFLAWYARPEILEYHVLRGRQASWWPVLWFVFIICGRYVYTLLFYYSL